MSGSAILGKQLQCLPHAFSVLISPVGSKLFAKVQMSFLLVGNRTCFSEKQ